MMVLDDDGNQVKYLYLVVGIDEWITGIKTGRYDKGTRKYKMKRRER